MSRFPSGPEAPSPSQPLSLLLITLSFLACQAVQDQEVSQTKLSQKLRELASRAPLVVAHRGDSASNPENTLPAFASAVRKGAQLVELDFRQTKDGVLVCIHDDTLERTTNCEELWKGKGKGEKMKKMKMKQPGHKVADHTLAELRQLDAGSWKHKRFKKTRIPTLEEALDTIQKGSITMIEHKAGEAKKLVSLLRRKKLVDSVLVQSFDWHWLEEVHRLEPKLTLAALGGTKKEPDPTPALLERVPATGACILHWKAKKLTPEDVDRLHESGYLVCVYTVNDKAGFEETRAKAVDAITTDQPARLADFLKKSLEKKVR